MVRSSCLRSTRGRPVVSSLSCSGRASRGGHASPGKMLVTATPVPDQEDWCRQCRRAGVQPQHAARVKNPGYLIAPMVPLHGVSHADVWVWQATLAAWRAAAKFGRSSPELSEEATRQALTAPERGTSHYTTPADQPAPLKARQSQGSALQAGPLTVGQSRASSRRSPLKGKHDAINNSFTVGDWLKSMERYKHMPTFDPTLPAYDDVVAEMLSSAHPYSA
mmetsp:Transcript_2164/g.3970  ORF Transcript_2164/g.3970 Transcript_2164/m.3970 type:complete len:221 (-) Transcript_2164:416-1078(-)